MPELEKHEIVDRFDAFLSNHHSDDLKKLGREYPEQTRIYFNFDELEQYDRRLADGYEREPSVRRAANEALRYHEEIAGAAYLPKARILPKMGRQELRVCDLKTVRHTSYVTVVGKVADAEPIQQKLDDAVQRCNNCGTKNIIDARNRDRTEPHTCRGCERVRVDYELVSRESSFYESREIRLQSIERRANNISAPWTATVELVDDAVFDLQVGDWVRCSGTVSFEIISGTDIEPTLVGYRAEPADPVEEAEDGLQAERFRRAQHELNRGHLLGFTNHVHDLLGDTDNHSFTEEDIKTKIVTPFLEVLGWDPYSRDVLMEYDTGEGERVDYMLAIENEPTVAVEVKGPSVPVTRTKLVQLDKYVAQLNADYGVLTNGSRYKIVRNLPSRERHDPNREGHLVLDATYELLPEFSDEVGLLARAVLDS